jgi:VIT1/CCC1 family predicted Fe2+/Mn2+ transporter
MIPAKKGFHRSGRIGWLRAVVLGANDGTISVACLVVGVAATGATQHGVLIAGVAGVVSGAMSMAAGEYVSVQSQADTERSDIERERHALGSSSALPYSSILTS